MSVARFVYVVYIATRPESVWNAIVEGDVTRKYWGHENVSDWTPGSPWRHVTADGRKTVKVVGKVVEVVPPRRLVITWAAPEDEASPAKHTRVTFEIEKLADMVRLTVTHDDLVAGSDMERGSREAWPRVISSMKSFLETGRPLDTWAGHH